MVAKIMVINKPSLFSKLDGIPDKVATKALTYTMKNLSSRCPSDFAKIAAKRYRMKVQQLNPNTKRGGGKGKVKGVTDVTGCVASISWEYRGPRLTVGGSGDKGDDAFWLSNPGAPHKTPYTLKVEILRGQKTKVGHWNLPYSEDGKYSKKSPWMKPGGGGGRMGLMRVGRGFGDPLRGPSVPQMVVNDENEPAISAAITKRAEETLMKKIESLMPSGS